MNVLLEALHNGDPRSTALVLVFASLLLRVAASNIAWGYHTPSGKRLLAGLAPSIESPAAHYAVQLVPLAYYLGIPYVALILGEVDIRAMGLGFLDWADGLRWSVVIVLAAWIVLQCIWAPYLRATREVPVRFNLESLAWPRRVVQVVYLQAHWAFYRAAAILALTQVLTDDQAVYWGTIAGIGLVLLEAWADPAVRRGLARVGEGEAVLWSGGQAILNAVGFVLTRNVWLLALIHLALEFTVPHLRAMPRLAPPPVSAPAPSRPTVSG